MHRSPTPAAGQPPDPAIENLAATLPPGRPLLGLDLGAKNIGIARSDIGQRIATPLETIRRTKFARDAQALLAICDRDDVGALVLGLPVNMDGSQGPRCQATRAFARNLAPLTDRPIVFWDERLSTVAAERAMIEADLSRQKRARRIDAAAAAFILQGALDRLNALRRAAGAPPA